MQRGNLDPETYIGRIPYGDKGRHQGDASMSQGTPEMGKPLEARIEAWSRSSFISSERTDLAGTLTLDCSLQNSEIINTCCLRQSSIWPQKTNTGLFLDSLTTLRDMRHGPERLCGLPMATQESQFLCHTATCTLVFLSLVSFLLMRPWASQGGYHVWPIRNQHKAIHTVHTQFVELSVQISHFPLPP